MVVMVMADYTTSKKRVRGDDSSEVDTPEVKRIKDDLLGILDESDPDPASQDLASVIKSFEDEISAKNVVVVDLTSCDSGESQPELGYLLEASDDELGLPPSSSKNEEGKNNESTELVRVDSSDSVEDTGFWAFEEHMPGYESFEFGVYENYNTETYASFNDGLFEHSVEWFDYSDQSWGIGTFPAD